MTEYQECGAMINDQTPLWVLVPGKIIGEKLSQLEPSITLTSRRAKTACQEKYDCILRASV